MQSRTPVSIIPSSTSDNGEAERRCECKTPLKVGNNLTVSHHRERGNIVFFNETTCSYNAYQRGSGQRIVAFSYYNNIENPSAKQKKYLDGIKGNLDLMPILYPGWIMRLYINLEAKDKSDLQKMVFNNPNIDLCDVHNLPKETSKIYGSNWRFYPALDPQVILTLRHDNQSNICEFKWLI